MYKALRRIVFAVCLATTAIFVPGIAFGQGQAASGATDIFSSIHQDLSEAADRSLASVLANRPWMNSPRRFTNPGDPSKTEEILVLRVRGALERVHQLKPILEPILRDEGVPVELSSIVLVESGGLATALSPKGARGVWQFMPDTARRYGLAVDGSRDERLDVVRSTHAAARYLRDLHLRFGDWRLVLAAYNAGELAVSKAINRSRSSDVSSILVSGYLPLETERYVPAIDAAIERLYYRVSWFAPIELEGTNIVYASSTSSER